jgi:hypothetical protein
MPKIDATSGRHALPRDARRLIDRLGCCGSGLVIDGNKNGHANKISEM